MYNNCTIFLSKNKLQRLHYNSKLVNRVSARERWEQFTSSELKKIRLIQIKQLYGTVLDPYRTHMEFADEVTCKRIYSVLNFS